MDTCQPEKWANSTYQSAMVVALLYAERSQVNSNSNEYTRSHLNSNDHFKGSKEKYCCPRNASILVCKLKRILVIKSWKGSQDYPIKASKVFTLVTFILIWASFYPKVCMLAVCDECHQMHFTIILLDAISQQLFTLKWKLSFNEGDVAPWPFQSCLKVQQIQTRLISNWFIFFSKFNPWSIFNQVDVFEGQNVSKIGIPKNIQMLPTTQKAVVNANIQWILWSWCNESIINEYLISSTSIDCNV